MPIANETEKIIELKNIIRDVPDFPKKGIIFKDITTLLARGDMFRRVIDEISDRYKSAGIEKVVGIESRGFIFGAPIAYNLSAGVVPIRKKGKLPYKTLSETYSLEYGTDTLEMHEDALKPGMKVIIVDDLLATGGTAKATARLVEKSGAKIAGIAFVIELGFLNGRKALNNYDVFSLLKYD